MVLERYQPVLRSYDFEIGPDKRFSKRYFIIDQQKTRLFVHYSLCFSLCQDKCIRA